MSTYEKAVKAIARSGIGFNYNITCNDAGHPKYIVNFDARIPYLGSHSNDREMRLPVDSSMSISEMTANILEKWGKK